MKSKKIIILGSFLLAFYIMNGSYGVWKEELVIKIDNIGFINPPEDNIKIVTVEETSNSNQSNTQSIVKDKSSDEDKPKINTEKDNSSVTDDNIDNDTNVSNEVELNDNGEENNDKAIDNDTNISDKNSSSGIDTSAGEDTSSDADTDDASE